MNATAIARALRGGRKSGSGWIACCPSHEDGNPSLSLRDAADRRVLVHCHAGCPQTAVINALKEAGLWEHSAPKVGSRRITAEYSYCDETGDLRYQVIRTIPKGFFQRFPDGRGGWVNRKHPQQLLYRLPEVLTAQIVVICEGERDVETMRSHGFVATTIAGGANAPWLPSFTEALRGRDVVLVPDNDEAGWYLMRRIATALCGNTSSLTCFDDHHRTGAKDITEWFQQGRAETEFVYLMERTTCRSR